MKFFKSKYLDPNDVLRDAAGPSPWYLRAFPPKLERFVWEDLGEGDATAGMTVLKNLGREVVAVFNMYCYVLPIGMDRLLVWYQPYREGKWADSIEFLIIYLNELSSIGGIKKSLVQIEEEKLNVVTSVALDKYSLSANVGAGLHKAVFPPEIQEIEELLVLGHSTAANGDNNKMNLCIFRLMPNKREFEVIPQDWFNNGDADSGYQWVTRVAREPRSGKIYGDGIRISGFVLDESNRQVEKWFHKSS